MNSYLLLGAVIGIVTYFPLCFKISRGLKQNLLTWILWAVLDGITFVSVFLQSGNFWLPGAYMLGSTSVAITLLVKKQERFFGWFEWTISFLVVACMVVWYFAGNQMTTVAGTIAVTLAGIPLFKDAYDRPEEIPLGTYTFFLVANFLSTMGGKDWSIEERLYPAACTAYCLILVLLALRRFNEEIEMERR